MEVKVNGLLRCSRLQASAVAFGEKLPIPEIVAIGGQSDGKSSLLEALLGKSSWPYFERHGGGLSVAVVKMHVQWYGKTT